MNPDFRANVRTAATAISSAATEDELFQALRAVENAFGADQAHASLRYGQNHAVKPVMLLTTHKPEAVITYLDQKAYEADPVALHLKARTTVASSEDLDWSASRAQEVRELKQRFGVGPTGLGVSVFGPAGEWAMVTLSSGHSPAPWIEVMPESKCMFSRIGTLFFERMHELAARSRPENPPLSPRETEALTWTARGKTIAETAMILGLAASTVRHLLDNARDKLHAATKAEAVAKAMQHRLIQVG
jgi:DNA-binding CsgD family transcriptional regulator